MERKYLVGSLRDTKASFSVLEIIVSNNHDITVVTRHTKKNEFFGSNHLENIIVV